jgi:hypothetical protein
MSRAYPATPSSRLSRFGSASMSIATILPCVTNQTGPT